MANPRRVAIMLELEWPYKRHARVFAGTQQYADEHGWHSIMDEYVHATLAECSRGNAPYDGIIARATEEVAECARRIKIPIVNVWVSSPVCDSLPSVFPDHAAAGRLRAEHLLSRGLVRFAALVTQQDCSTKIESKAFAERLKESGYPCACGMVLHSPVPMNNWRNVKQAMVESMNSWTLPIGVYVGPDINGRMLAQMCHNRGWRVPNDVAIIAGNNEETFCEGLRPTITSVELGYEQVGYTAAKLLDQMMDGQPPPKEPIWIAPRGLVVRESTDFFAVQDESVAAALKFIAENSHKPIGLRDVARAVSTEERTLRRRFQKHLNRPIAAEIRRVRIERAKRELAQGDRTLKEIAAAVGFGERMRMYEIFRRELGITPSQYRRDRQINARH